MHIKTGTVDGVATIEIARPEKKNALTLAMYQAMTDAITAAVADAAVRAVLITGQPGIFTSGNDLEDFVARPPVAGPEADELPVFRFMHALAGCEKPVVAAVTGAAIGIGATMLLHCDFVVVADDARLAMPFVNLGLVPEFAASVLLAQRVGPARASQMLLLGDPVTGAEAVELGLATTVLPAGEVVRQARRIAERFNQLPPAAVRESKRLLQRPQREAVQAAMAAERESFIARLASPEAKEAFSAFFDKRRPDWSTF